MSASARLASYINLAIVLLFGCTSAGAVLLIPERTRQALGNIIGAFEAVSVGVLWTAGAVLFVALVGGLALLSYIGWQYGRFARGRADLRDAEALEARHRALLAGSRVTTAPRDHQIVETFATPQLAQSSASKLLHLGDTHVNGKGNWAETHITRWQQWQLLTAPRAAGPDIVPVAQLAAGQPDLLTELDTVQRCLIVGASDVGKTTLLLHIQARRRTNSRVVAIDPHAYPNKWIAHRTFGAGRNYQEIDWGLTELLKLMIRRYDDIGQGRVPEMGHSKITLVIDEWRAIVYNVKGSSEAIKALLTESRKAAFSVFVATHSERVRALGIEGEGDLKDGFAVVRLSLVNGQRMATLDKGNGEIPVTLPGPFILPPTRGELEGGDDTAPIVNLNPATYHPEPDTVRDEFILKMSAEGRSRKEICEALGWTPGGKQYQQIDQVLARFGRI